MYFTKYFAGEKRPLVNYKSGYILDLKELLNLELQFREQNQNMWNIINHCVGTNVERSFWTLGRTRIEKFNNRIYSTPIELRKKLMDVLDKYEIYYQKSIMLLDEEQGERYQKEMDDLYQAYAYEDVTFDHAKEAKEEMESWGSGWEWNID